jgi:hypothetical protein
MLTVTEWLFGSGEKFGGIRTRVSHPDKSTTDSPGRAPDKDLYAEAVRWLLTPVTRERHISPWYSMTLEQFVIERVTKGSPQEAFMAVPYHPATLLAQAEFLQIMESKEIGRADWLHSYVVSLPASESSAEGWRKCAEILVADHLPALAQQALQKAQIAGR